ncbi:MAG: biotin transporter BioY [Puniceicoccales bacterium]|nr:biotin transporter BioY [Puniceicoccales bacterium]
MKNAEIYVTQPRGLGSQLQLISMPWWLKLAYGVFLLYLMAQITIPLPWTPVPITGQSLGVFCVALTMGSLATPIVAIYWLLGLCGLPVLAGASAGVLWGAKSGYLLGMVVSAEVISRLKSRGFAKTWWGTLAVLGVGEIIIFALGNWVLSYFVPRGNLLMAGFWPFLPGDTLKAVIAATISRHFERYVPSGSGALPHEGRDGARN